MEEERKEKEEKQGGAGNLTSLERETIITYNNAENTANCFTLSLPVRRRLLQLAKEYPEEVHINKQEEDMIDVDVPKSWVKIRPPRRLSDEQRAALAERGRNLYEKYRQSQQAEENTDDLDDADDADDEDDEQA